MNCRTNLELVTDKDACKEFDGRAFWSQTDCIAGGWFTCRWVANGEKHMDAIQFMRHADRIFYNLEAISLGRTIKLSDKTLHAQDIAV